jgi:hypothetical protein
VRSNCPCILAAYAHVLRLHEDLLPHALDRSQARRLPVSHALSHAAVKKADRAQARSGAHKSPPPPCSKLTHLPHPPSTRGGAAAGLDPFDASLPRVDLPQLGAFLWAVRGEVPERLGETLAAVNQGRCERERERGIKRDRAVMHHGSHVRAVQSSTVPS